MSKNKILRVLYSISTIYFYNYENYRSLFIYYKKIEKHCLNNVI